MYFLRQNTATTVKFGPFLAPADGITAKTALSPAPAPAASAASSGVSIDKNGTMAGYTLSGWAHDRLGKYTANLATGDVDTLGRLEFVFVDPANYAPMRVEFQVISQAVYDWLFGATAPLTDKTGFSLTQTFPTNFASLLINASGHISRVTLTDTLTTYTGNTPQTGDAFARIGATGSGLTSLAPSSAAPTDWLGAAGVSAGAAGKIATAVEQQIMDEADSRQVLQAIVDKINSVDTDLSGLSIAAIAAASATAVRDVSNASPAAGSLGAAVNGQLTAAGVRTALGMGSANLDSQLSGINAKTTNLPSDPADASDIAAAFGTVATTLGTLFTTPLAQSYAAVGAAGSIAQILYMIQQRLTEFGVSGTQIMIKKLDGTQAAVLTLDDATNPTSSHRTV